MRLTVLGNNGPYPSENAACSGYLLSSDSGETNLLIDCGTGVLARLRGIMEVDCLDAVVLSHLHFDHMSDMLPMVYALQFHTPKCPLPVYAPETPENVRSLLENPYMDVWKMKDCTVGEMKLSFLSVRHPIETYAIRVECDGVSFVYTGDTNTDIGLELFCDHADLMLADAGLSMEHWSEKAPHLSAALCGELAANARVKRLLLTHLNPRYTPEALCTEAKQYFAAVEFAICGESYYI